ncbi:MAG: SPASM domain-containing protein [Deltaproteobacteria bacterium]|nr:SPASM domain-containing protein [Deltaproteobacteria bacterium]
MAKISPYAYGHLPLYFYLTGTYSRFLATGKCLGFPLILLVQTQSFCNGRCSICPYPTVSKQLPQGRMEWSLFQKVIDEAAAEPLLASIVFELHNEPLLDERIFDCVSYIKTKAPGKRVAVVTNGELLDRFSPEDIVRSNLDSLSISLNAHSRETYERINTGLDYEKVMDNISRMLSNPSTRQKTRLNFILTEQNESEVYEATRYWRERGVSTKVSGVTNRAGILENYEKLRPKAGYDSGSGPAAGWRRLKGGVRHALGCHVPFYEMNVLFNGDVLICSEDWNRTTVVGNVATQSLKEIWNSEKANENRRLLLKKKFEQLDSCKECCMAR